MGAFSLSGALSGFGEHFKDKYLIGASGAGILGLAAIATMFFYQRHQEQAINDREQTVARDSARYSAVLLARRSAETTRDSVYQQLAIIKSIDDSRYTWPHVLAEISLIAAALYLADVHRTDECCHDHSRDEQRHFGRWEGQSRQRQEERCG